MSVCLSNVVERLNMVMVHVSVGSNIDKENNIRSAMEEMRSVFGDIAVSNVYESASVGFDGEPFYNCVVSFYADDLAKTRASLRDIEDQHQRDRGAQKFSNRTLDLDILLFGNADFHSQGIDIPRGEIVEYAFVLKPLSELSSDLVHPVIEKTYRQLWQEYEIEHPNINNDLRQVGFSW